MIRALKGSFSERCVDYLITHLGGENLENGITDAAKDTLKDALKEN